MPLSLTLLFVAAGLVLLAFGVFSTVGAIRVVSGGIALLIALAATAATVGLFWLGQKNHWTSDGPGMLFVMIAIVVFALVALIGWMFVFGVAASVVVPSDAVPTAPREGKRVLGLLGVAFLGIAAAGQGITAFMARGRAAHSSPVVGVSFPDSRARLVTLDAGGTLVDWDLHLRREDRRRTVPELAGATEFFMDGTGDEAFAIANGTAVRFVPFLDRPLQTIPEARHIARGSTVVIARERSLLFVRYDDWSKPPYRDLAWPQPISAIGAADMFVAVADAASVSLLDGRPGSVRLVASVPAPGAIRRLDVLYDGTVVALDGSGAGWAIDVRRGLTAPLPGPASLVAAGKHVWLMWEREVSEYGPRTRTATRVARIASGARSVDTWDDRIALGFERGEVVLATLQGGALETTRLTARR